MLVVFNISLSFIALLLVLNLFGIKAPSFGKALYLLDQEDPSCVVQWQQTFTPWSDIDLCCLEARRQLECVSQNRTVGEVETDWLCSTGKDTIQYHLNNKAYFYCGEQVFWE